MTLRRIDPLALTALVDNAYLNGTVVRLLLRFLPLRILNANIIAFDLRSFDLGIREQKFL